MNKNDCLKLIMSLSGINNRISKRIDNQLSIHGTNYSELMVLHHLSSAPKLTMRRIDLADEIGLTASGITRMLKPMEKLHLVEKEINARDARVSLVKLTPSGETLYQDAWQSFKEVAYQSSNALDETQLSQLLTLLNNLK